MKTKSHSRKKSEERSSRKSKVVLHFLNKYRFFTFIPLNPSSSSLLYTILVYSPIFVFFNIFLLSTPFAFHLMRQKNILVIIDFSFFLPNNLSCIFCLISFFSSVVVLFSNHLLLHLFLLLFVLFIVF